MKIEKYDIFKENFGEWIDVWKDDGDFDVIDACIYLYQQEINYNNADPTSHQEVFSELEILKYLKKYLREK